MTFSAPKSVSVLFAIGDEELSAALASAHREAVDAAIRYLEREACRVRRGHNGTRQERERGDPRGWARARSARAGGFVAAAYRHRMSRAQDPQLHTHVVAANMARGADGRWTALDARHIYEHAKAGGCVYQAHLRAAVRERVPWASWGPVRSGMAELQQVPAEVIREFSTRRRRIVEREAELVAAGVAVGDRGRERIAFDTREAKREVGDGEWRAEVRARAAEHGLGPGELARLADAPRQAAPEPVSERDLRARLFGPSGVTATANSFAARDVVTAVATAAGQGLDADSVQELAAGLLDSAEVVALADEGAGPFTTRELLEAERAIVTHAVAGRGSGVAVVEEVDALTALAVGGWSLSEEQERVVVGVVGTGNRVDSVEALAGTGKTTSGGAMRAIYERAGYRVLGAAPTGRAVRELKEQAGITESRTLDGWLLKLDSDADALRVAPDGGAPAAVMVLDEAGMASTRMTARLLDAAAAADVKVVALGDSGQLASVQAGGWFGALTRHGGSFELREVMRQRDPHERRGLAQVHRGEPDSYLQRKAARGELTVFGGDLAAADIERAAMAEWASARERWGAEQALLICRDNRRRERLNELARGHLKTTGELTEGAEIAGRDWCVGDQVIARRNDRARDVDNGMRGTIVRAEPGVGVELQTRSGAVRRLDAEYVAQHLEYAYALTAHAMQGSTVEWAAVIGRPGDFTRNWSYTALSRARQPTRILVVDEPTPVELDRAEIAPDAAHAAGGAIDRMTARMRERDDEDLAVEQLGGIKYEAQGSDVPTDEPATSDPARLTALRTQLAAVNDELAMLPLRDVKALDDLDATVASLRAHHARISRQRAWRERRVRRFNLRQIEARLADEAERRARLLERIGDPAAVRTRTAELEQRRWAVGDELGELRTRLVDEEIARRPRWLENALGPEPEEDHLAGRWRRTAREVAGHRLDHGITDPDHALGSSPSTRWAPNAVERAILDTRAALELDGPQREQGTGQGLG